MQDIVPEPSPEHPLAWISRRDRNPSVITDQVGHRSVANWGGTAAQLVLFPRRAVFV
jgi:hypothetical protein